MNYALAKQLKDAGFPQDGENFISPQSNTEKIDHSLLGKEMGYVCFPTLSELIEACGKETSLWNSEGEWHAGSTSDDFYAKSDYYYDDSPRDMGHGKTPEEAVAKLWLELNKKIEVIEHYSSGELVSLKIDGKESI